MAGKVEKALRAQIETLVEAMQEERRAGRRTSMTMSVLSVTLLAIIVVFLASNYSHISDEWTEEKLASEFENELQVLQPTASTELRELGRFLLPIYADAGRREFTAMAPEIARRIKKEARQLGEDLQNDAHDRLSKSMSRIRGRAEEVIFATYPTLENEAEQQKMTENFHKLTEDAVATTVNDFATLFASDIGLLETRIRAFNVDASDKQTVDLEKRFIHLWLKLLDAEIMSK